MNVTRIDFDPSSFGITQKSLKMLRDLLATQGHHRLAVVEVPTNDLCCGFFIFDWDYQRATWTGDGFRTDRQGEGGAGMLTAELLLAVFNLYPIPWEPVNLDALYGEGNVEGLLLEVAQKIAAELSEGVFQRPIDGMPPYGRPS